jgi:hypothetical protein
VKIKWSGKRTLVAAALLVGVLWLYAMGSEKRQGEGGEDDTSTNTAQCRVESTVDGLNIRSAPALNPGNVIGELNQGDQINAVKVVQNGFRKLAEGRWVSDEFARPIEGANC